MYTFHYIHYTFHITYASLHYTHTLHTKHHTYILYSKTTTVFFTDSANLATGPLNPAVETMGSEPAGHPRPTQGHVAPRRRFAT